MQTIGDETKTPEAVAEDFDVPLEAVREAIEYCTHNQALLQQEREEEEADNLAGQCISGNAPPSPLLLFQLID